MGLNHRVREGENVRRPGQPEALEDKWVLAPALIHLVTPQDHSAQQFTHPIATVSRGLGIT